MYSDTNNMLNWSWTNDTYFSSPTRQQNLEQAVFSIP